MIKASSSGKLSLGAGTSVGDVDAAGGAEIGTESAAGKAADSGVEQAAVAISTLMPARVSRHLRSFGLSCVLERETVWRILWKARVSVLTVQYGLN